MASISIEHLREHLQWAIELEHATLPPYLCALYSIRPGTNAEAVANIASVFIEEMLHMTLAANVLNAIGGQPVLDTPGFIPRYPAYLPHSAERLLVALAPFTPAAIETFMKIEKPEEADAPPEGDRYHTIGQFYRAIEDALKALAAALGERQLFCGDPARQITPACLEYHGSGRIVPVYDLASALAAIQEIEHQGEGLRHAEVWDGDVDMFHPERDEVAHYFRFLEITEGRLFQRGDTPKSGPTGPPLNVDWTAVYPMRENPRSDDFPEGSPIRKRMHAFNAHYSDLLRSLHRAFNGAPATLFATLAAMWELKDVAQALMQMPTGDGSTTAGPSFEYVAPVAADADEAAAGITVQANGPYVVSAGLPLSRKSIVYSELHEPLTWRKDAALPVDGTYRLCRCGHSARKPFCDGSHARAGFDGTERPPRTKSADRAKHYCGEHITMTDDPPLCTRAGFCGNRVENVWDMIPRSGDTRVRFALIQMIERCPGGRLGYELDDGQPMEPDLGQGIAVTKDGPLWVTGGIPVTLADGRTLEARNRVALCRCGRSSRKPLCDGTHAKVAFRDGEI